jgi:hypothetical protein
VGRGTMPNALHPRNIISTSAPDHRADHYRHKHIPHGYDLPVVAGTQRLAILDPRRHRLRIGQPFPQVTAGLLLGFLVIY